MAETNYAWIVTKDCLENETMFAAGPSGVDDADIEALKKGKGAAFKLYDDDGELYLTGRFLGDKNSEEAFGPLDDFGMPGYGCTGIKYIDEKTGK